jgi:deoxyribose-phosphate aldolase
MPRNSIGKMIIKLYAKWKIKRSNSLPYRPKMNGVVEAVNKNVKKIIQKMVVTYKDWHEMLPFALHAYRTVVRTSTGATLYTLVYGMEAVMPLKVENPSVRVLVDSEFRKGGMGKS